MQTTTPYQMGFKLCYAVLLILVALGTWQSIQATEASGWMIAAVRIIPLAAFMPAIIKVNIRGLIWLSFVLCLYFTDAVVDVVTLPNSALNISLAVVPALLFTLIMIFIRKNAKLRKAGLPCH